MPGYVTEESSGNKLSDKRRKRHNRNTGHKTPPPEGEDSNYHTTNEGKKSTLERHKNSDNGKEKWRLQIRKALNQQDTLRLRTLVGKGADVNLIISDVFNDTPLLYAVKHGSLEVVETLLESREVDLEQRDRSNHTAMDEAIRAWFVGGTMPASEKRFNLGKRYRIIKCLLGVGASNISHNFIDLLIFSNSNTKTGRQLMSKLVKLFCQKGNNDAKSRLLCILAPYKFTTDWIHSLLEQGADPTYLFKIGATRPAFPLTTAGLLVTSSNNKILLSRIDGDTSLGLQKLGDQWPEYRKVAQLLTLCGHELQLSVMRHLYLNHADTYRWMTEYRASPKPLRHLCRVAVRHQLMPNVIYALKQLNILPDKLKPYLIFE